MRVFVCCSIVALGACQSPAPVAPAAATGATASAAPAATTSAPSSPPPAATTSAAPAASPPKAPTPVAATLDGIALADRWVSDATCGEKSCDLVFDRHHTPHAAAAPVAIVQLTASGNEWRLPFDERVDVSMVVTSGALKVWDNRGPKRPVDVGTWSALAVGGGGVTLSGDARVVLVVATVDGRPVKEVWRERDQRPKASELTWKAPRDRKLEPRAIAPLELLTWGGGAYHARIVWGASDHPKAAVSVVVFSHDAPVKEHDHDTEWECLSVRSGEGTLTLSKEPVPVSAGDVVCVPPGKRHAWTPSGDKPLVAVQIYSPGGPEQRFKKLSGKQ